jgi:competence protein ComEC
MRASLDANKEELPFMVFKAHFLNVGCADCSIFEMGNDLVVIDCGYRRTGTGLSKPTNIASYIKNTIGKTYIDLLIISHPHHDHYIAMEDLIGNFAVAEFWGTPYIRRNEDNSVSIEDWNEYKSLKERLMPNAQQRFTCTKGIQKTFASEFVFTILGPRKNVNESETRECHDANLVVWVSSPANKFLVCGDASDTELDQVRTDYNLSSCNVLRTSHHGSINGANLEFIKAVSPRDAIISTAPGFFDNLPSDVALQRYRAHSTNIFRTDDGTATTPLRV